MKTIKNNPAVLIDFLPTFAKKDFFLILGGSIFMIALSHLRIYLPHSLVPHTGQTLGVLLIGLSFGLKRALISTGIFLFARPFIGLPFEIHTSGYLLGMFIASGVLGYLSQKGYARKFSTLIPVILLAKLIIYTCGVIVLSSFIGWEKAFLTGVIPFIPSMVVKTIFCAAMLPVVYKVVED